MHKALLKGKITVASAKPALWALDRAAPSAPTTAPDPNHKSRLSPALLTDQLCISGVPKTSALGSINLLEQLPELRETFYLLDYWFILKDVTQEQPGRRKTQEESTGLPVGHSPRGHSPRGPLPQRPTPPGATPPGAHSPRGSLSLHL